MDVYLDNASTSFPKPHIVTDAIYDFLVNIGGNSGRGNYSNSLESNRELLFAREKIAAFFNFEKSENVIFTNNITTSLNMLIRGILEPGDHVISSVMEHNSILRPLIDCKDSNLIQLDLVSASSHGFINPLDVENLIKSNTKAIILSHASNVCGAIQDLKAIGEICRKHNIIFIIDSAQSAGSIDVNIKDLNANAIAFTGHKCLLGPQGTGGFIIDDKLNEICKPIISGGTGSLSHSLHQPNFLPDKFECGTMNVPGIVGLSRGLDFINHEGISTIREKNSFLRTKLINGLSNIDGIKIYSSGNHENYTTCISFNYLDHDPSEVSYYLDTVGIKTRSGLHCAPLAHKALGTFPSGSVRFSIGYFNTEEEINYVLSCISKIKYNI